MAMTHSDSDHMGSEFMKLLQQRATTMEEKQQATITAGKPGEIVLKHWKYDNMYVMKLPNDQQGILRVSVGGGRAEVDYVSFRGDRARCALLLERAAKALKHEGG